MMHCPHKDPTAYNFIEITWLCCFCGEHRMSLTLTQQPEGHGPYIAKEHFAVNPFGGEECPARVAEHLGAGA